ncbi:MAG: RDD family protein [Burkholderiales bacterium]|nr:RDD family protein [Pseudomonadota bacterium]MCC7067945.1 RDD family protein [Burkholderiales bacterium]MCZ2134150.1 RDD family protein [Burkholderiales bacterium]
MTSAPTALPLAGLWRRFGAFVHELLFLLAWMFITGLVFAALSGESMTAGRPQILTGALAALQQLYFFVVIGAYFIYFWTNGRRSLACKTWSLRLANTSGGTISTRQAVVRYLATWIGPALGLVLYSVFGARLGAWWLPACLFNFVWAFVDRDHQFLHDRIAGTRVLLAD